MGTARPHPDLTTMHASRKANLHPTSHKRPAHRTADPSLPSPRPSTHHLRKKIRDTTRLLSHASHLPADARIESERALAGYKHDLQAADEAKRRAKMIGRYHMVRFFERQKATRHLKKLRRRLAETEDEKERREVEKMVHVAEVDVNYAVYCPLGEKYLSLYPQKQDGEGDGEVVERHLGRKDGLRFWGVVERCMVEGALEALRDGRGEFGGGGEGGGEGDEGGEVKGTGMGMGRGRGGEVEGKGSAGIPIRAKRARMEERVEVRGRGQRDESDGSDGGFFEE